MTPDVFRHLAAIRGRCRRRNALTGAVIGLLVVTAFVLAVLVARAAGLVPSFPLSLLAILAAGPLAGAGIGAVRPLRWPAIAALVDERAGLKDRACAALEYARRPAPGPFERLHLRDAEAQLAATQPRAVVPLRAPRAWPLLAAAYLLAVGLVLLPLVNRPAIARPAPAPAPVVHEADEIAKFADELAATADALESKELRTLAEKMKQLAERLREPGTDVTAALEEMSRLQAELAALKREFDTKLVDGELKNLGRAMAGAQPLRETGKALEAGKLGEAAEAAGKIREAPADKAEARASYDALSKAAGQMNSKGLSRLGRTTEKLAEGVKGDTAKLQESAKDLSRQIHEQERRKRIAEAFAREQQRLEECKNRCQQMNRELLEQKMAGKKPSPTDSPTSPKSASTADAEANAGRPNPKRPNGPKTKPDQGIESRAGDGPSHTDTEQVTPDAENSPGRRMTRDQHRQFKALSDALLDSELIPLGHKMAIRRYLELIRPPADAPQSP